MDRDREALLARLKAFGEANDRSVANRSEKMLNITADTGLFLWMLIRTWRPRRILEIGTSNGYSTIWLADALTEPSQEVVTLEYNPAKAEMAQANLAAAGLADRVRLEVGDATTYLQNASSESFDLIFLDAERSRYVQWWTDIVRTTADSGLVVVDNAVDKAEELQSFFQVVDATSSVRNVVVPLGNGELFIHKVAP